MNIIPFNFDAYAVRSIVIGGVPWFHAGDVCGALGIRNVSQAVEPLADRHKRMQNIGLPGSAPTFVSEAGLYKLVLRSNKVEAEGFQDWIVEEVLPTIRRTGGFGLATAPDPAVLAIVKTAYEEADRAVERRTRHDFYSSGPRVAERRAAIVAEEAAKRSLDASAVAAANQQSVTEVMATRYGDPEARRLLETPRARIDAEVSERLRLLAPRRRRR